MKLKSHMGKISVLLGIVFLVPFGESDLISNLKFGGSIIGFGLGIYAIKLKQRISGILGMLLNAISVLLLVLILGLLSVVTGVATSDETKSIVQDSVNQVAKELQTQATVNDAPPAAPVIPASPAAPAAPLAPVALLEAPAEQPAQAPELPLKAEGVLTPPPAPALPVVEGDIEANADANASAEAAPSSPAKKRHVFSVQYPSEWNTVKAEPKGIMAKYYQANKYRELRKGNVHIWHRVDRRHKEAGDTVDHYINSAIMEKIAINPETLAKITSLGGELNILAGDGLPVGASIEGDKAHIRTFYIGDGANGYNVMAFMDGGKTVAVFGLYGKTQADILAVWPDFAKLLSSARLEEK